MKREEAANRKDDKGNPVPKNIDVQSLINGCTDADKDAILWNF